MHMNRLVMASRFGVAAIVVLASASHAASDEGKTSYTSYYTVKSAQTVKLGEGRSLTSVEFTGLTRNDEGKDMFDNMSVLCLGDYFADGGVTEGQGACTEVDADGDEVFTKFTFSSATKPPAGVHTMIGGTGKYAGISGEASFTVQYLKPPAEGMRMFVVPHQVTWKRP